MRSSHLLLAESLPRSLVAEREGSDLAAVVTVMGSWAAIPDSVKAEAEGLVGWAARQEVRVVDLGAWVAVEGGLVADTAEEAEGLAGGSGLARQCSLGRNVRIGVDTCP